MFYLDATSPSATAYFIRFHAPDEERKMEWLSAIRSAKQNLNPPGATANGHRFFMHSFDRATECDYCGKLMKGLYWQGYICSVTYKYGHKQCLPALTKHNVPHAERVKRKPRIHNVMYEPKAVDNHLAGGFNQYKKQEKQMKASAHQSSRIKRTNSVIARQADSLIHAEHKLKSKLELKTEGYSRPAPVRLRRKARHKLVLDPQVATLLCYKRELPTIGQISRPDLTLPVEDDSYETYPSDEMDAVEAHDDTGLEPAIVTTRTNRGAAF